jgi:hypothetical protein
MTENPNVDNLDLEGAGGNQPPVSQDKGNSIAGAPQSSQEFLALAKKLELVESNLKGLQSRQDKGQNETQRFMEEIKAHVAKGLSLDEAQEAVSADREKAVKDQLLYKIAAKLGLDDSLPNTAGNSENATDEVAKVLREYEVNENDPMAVKFIALKGAELKAAVADYAFKKSKVQPLDSSAASSMQGGAVAKESVQREAQKYIDEVLAARGNKSLIKGIKDKYRKAGVPVDSVNFSV